MMLIVASPAAAADRADARRAMARGVGQFYAGNARAARIELLNAIKADPDWALPRAVQARVYLALGDGEAAEAELRRAVEEGMPQAQIGHLQLHAWLLQNDLERVLATSDIAPAAPISAGYAHRIRAKAAIAQGDFERAAKFFDQAVAQAPDASLLWADIGSFRMMTGNIGGAADAANRAVALNPRNSQALMLMGEVVRGQYGLVASLPWFERVLEIDPGNVSAMVQLASTLGDAGRARDMLGVTRQILSIDQTNVDAWYLQAVLAARAGKTDLARALLYRIEGRKDQLPAVKLLKAVLDLSTGNSEQAIAQLKTLVAAQPDNLKARRLLGTAMWRAGDAPGAITVLEPVARRADADSYTLSVIGRAYEMTGNRVAAAAYLDRAALPARGEPAPFEPVGDLERMTLASGGNPDNADVAIPRITQLIASGRAGEALRLAERLRSLNPGTPAAHVLVGDALITLARPADAAKAYQAAANMRFSETTALRFVEALRRSGQSAAALRVLDLYLSQNPRSISALMLASEHFLATAQWDPAITTLEGLRTRIGNRDATILNNLAWAWFGKGDSAKAMNYATAAYSIASANPALASSYGWMLFKTGRDKARGVAFLQKAVGIAPQIPALRYKLAQALVETGQGAAAKPHLVAALAVPDFAERAAAAKLLAGL